MQVATGTQQEKRRGSVAMWFGALGGAAAWAVHILIIYPIVPWACGSGSLAPLWAATVITALVALSAAAVSWRRMRKPETDPAVQQRSRFMAATGLGLDLLFFIVILVESIPALTNTVCEGFGNGRIALQAAAPGAAQLLGRLIGLPLAMAAPGAPLQAENLWSSYSWDPLVVGPVGLATLVYAWGARRRRARGRSTAPRRFSVAQLCAFVSGLGIFAFAAMGPLDAAAETLFSFHMAQHLVLTLVVAPLLVLGSSTQVWVAALPHAWRRPVGQPMVRLGSMATRPAAAVGLHTLALWIWHLPSLYEAALQSTVLHALEHASFVGTAMLVWSMVGQHLVRYQAQAGVAALAIFANTMQSAVLGLLISLSPIVWYASQTAPLNFLGYSALEDQQLAGLLMWIPMGALNLALALALVAVWLEASERAALRREGSSRLPPALALLLVGLLASVPACRQRQVDAPMPERLQATGKHGRFNFHVQIKPHPIVINQLFEVHSFLREHGSGAPVTGALVAVNATMPAHGHGMVTAPEHVEIRPGHYVTRGMKMHMPGQWVLSLRAKGVATDEAELPFTLVAGTATAAQAAVSWSQDERAIIYSLSPLPPLPQSAGNAFADDAQAARLGQRLFFDEGLSANAERSCGTCHQPQLHFTDGLARAVGHQRLSLNTPSVVTAAWSTFVGWDGRNDSVWAQALRPLTDHREMGASRGSVVTRLRSHHQQAYERVFGPLPQQREEDKIDSFGHRIAIDRVFANVGKALEAYQRQLAPGAAPFDKFVAALRQGDGKGGGHLNLAAQRGLRLFIGEGQCASCHNGPLLSDQAFHNLGLPAVPGDEQRPGRSLGAKLVARDSFRCGTLFSDARAQDCQELRFMNVDGPDLLGAFKTPSLRNVAATAPYMHGGQLATLAEVIAFYRSRPGRPALGSRDPLLAKIPRTLSTAELIAFLEALTSPLPTNTWLKPPASLARSEVR